MFCVGRVEERVDEIVEGRELAVDVGNVEGVDDEYPELVVEVCGTGLWLEEGMVAVVDVED